MDQQAVVHPDDEIDSVLNRDMSDQTMEMHIAKEP